MDLFAWLNLIVAVFFVLVGYYYFVHIPNGRKKRSEMSEAELWQWAYKKMHNYAFVRYAIWSLLYAICFAWTLPAFGLIFHLRFLMKNVLINNRYTWIVFNKYPISNDVFGYYFLSILPVAYLSMIAVIGYEKWSREMNIIESAAKKNEEMK